MSKRRTCYYQGVDYVGDIYQGDNNGLIFYVSLKHRRNECVKITRRIESMDLKIRKRFPLEVEIWELRLWRS